MNKCIVWDRDGIINDLIKHNDRYTAPWHINEFKFKPNIKKILNRAKQLGFLNFIVTNQPDVLDGKLLQSHLDLMNRMILNRLPIDEICNIKQRNTPYYKPNSQTIIDLIQKYEINTNKSYMVGDTWKDIVAGHNSDLTTIFVGESYISPVEYNDIYPKHIVYSTNEAILLIEEIELND